MDGGLREDREDKEDGKNTREGEFLARLETVEEETQGDKRKLR